MQHVKMLVILALLISGKAIPCGAQAPGGDVPPHPKEIVDTYFPDAESEFVGFTSEPNPKGPFFHNKADMNGGTCRTPAEEQKHKMYVFQLEQMAKKCAAALKSQSTIRNK